MKLNGSFVLREIAGEWLAIPVGESALRFGGMIVLNPSSRVIWECLQQDTDLEKIVESVTQRFEISPDAARADAIEFITQMKQEDLISD